MEVAKKGVGVISPFAHDLMKERLISFRFLTKSLHVIPNLLCHENRTDWIILPND